MYELISTSILLGSYKNRRKLSDAWPEVYYAFPDYSFLCMLLVAQILLILTVGGSGIWLKFHRNPYEFILVNRLELEAISYMCQLGTANHDAILIYISSFYLFPVMLSDCI